MIREKSLDGDKETARGVELAARAVQDGLRAAGAATASSSSSSSSTRSDSRQAEGASKLASFGAAMVMADKAVRAAAEAARDARKWTPTPSGAAAATSSSSTYDQLAMAAPVMVQVAAGPGAEKCYHVPVLKAVVKLALCEVVLLIERTPAAALHCMPHALATAAVAVAAARLHRLACGYTGRSSQLPPARAAAAGGSAASGRPDWFRPFLLTPGHFAADALAPLDMRWPGICPPMQLSAGGTLRA